MFQMILNNFQKIFKRNFKNFSKLFSRGGGHQRAFFFNFSPFQAILSWFWFFPIFCKIDPIGGEGRGGPKILVCDKTY